MIDTDFLARTLERTSRTIDTTQKLPHLRSAQVRMSNRDPAPLTLLLIDYINIFVSLFLFFFIEVLLQLIAYLRIA